MKNILPFLIISCVSCSTEKPLSTLPSQNNHTYRVDYLFEHDGCKVYRFYDMGKYVYFTSCQGEAIVANNDSTYISNTTSLKDRTGYRN